MVNKELMFEYDELLLGNRNGLSQGYFANGEMASEQNALELMRYAFETYLQWTPFELCDWLSWDVLELLKLKPIVRFVRFPLELNPERDLFYIACKLYPRTIHFSEADLTLAVYKKMLSGEIKKYPKEFFSGAEGMNRAAACLVYAIEQFMPVDNVYDLYAAFGKSSINRFLRKQKLMMVCNDLFGDPLDFLHFTLPKQQKQLGMYFYCQFISILNDVKSELRNKKLAKLKNKGTAKEAGHEKSI